ncbi:MAG: tRNA uridine-5-carboxymethylaminomethyl(34) synthesis GTPase MnmE [Polyangiaceae bacterium UTPRO1]|jgi:tRNA modification GTPase|nr:tRNA uridine-5-carboxymethylaminomethyl(34) synthesis GTPase MnmE [Myxococcales bacterium]OQY67646.1 MAG: tRNA uridine-5-carboxymethylaminomethyl(34) synthesis GTPase MnmE [Polyangiaceae bacterium UTPRO1]
MSSHETIAAIATAPGPGGIAIVRVSGSEACAVADAVFRRATGSGVPESRRIYVGNLVDPATGEVIDEVLAFGMRGPKSFTGEDVVEIHCHGGTLVTRRILETICARPAVRPAEPGEFTKRAFLNGRIDLVQAEAVADLIAARSEAGRRLAMSQLEGHLSNCVERLRGAIVGACARCEVALDFPEEDVPEFEPDEVRGELIRVRRELEAMAATFERGRLRYAGARVALIGRPNVGKSSLMNALAGHERAIVTPVPGTTRDVLEAAIVIDGAPVVILDTAGLRDAAGVVEELGIERTHRTVEDAECVLAIFDASAELHVDDWHVARALRHERTIAVLNKTDIGIRLSDEAVRLLVGSAPIVRVSAVTRDGLDELTAAIGTTVFGSSCRGDADEILLVRARHHEAVREALFHLCSAEGAMGDDSPLELVASDLRRAAVALSAITGQITSEDVLDRVFADFCLGK